MSDNDNKLDIGYVPDDPDFGHDNRVEKKVIGEKTELKKKSSVKKSHAKNKAKEKVIEKLTLERDEFKDKYLRTLAEIDNFRKRVKREKEEFQKFVLADFLKELLVISDNLERALKVKEDSEGDSITSGVKMIYKQLMELLKKNGVEEIEALRKPFDPNIHQALSKEENHNFSEPTIIEVYQKGFIYNNKLLRPALTKVAIPPEPIGTNELKGN